METIFQMVGFCPKNFTKSKFVVLKKNEIASLMTQSHSDFVLSLLSDSNQRPRDYKSRALAN